MDQFFYEIIIESTISILEIIQEKGVEIHVYRLMEDDMVLLLSIEQCQVEPISFYNLR